MNEERVVVTGVGMITPLGIGVDVSWNNLIAGKPGIVKITQFDASAFPTQIAGEVAGFNPEDYIEPKEIKKMDRFIHFSIAAASMAINDAGLKITDRNSERVGVVVGSGIGGLHAIEHYHSVVLEKLCLCSRLAISVFDTYEFYRHGEIYC